MPAPNAAPTCLGCVLRRLYAWPMAEAPGGVEREFPLARLTTIRTGGPAEFFARPGSIGELERLLAWAAEEELEVGVVGSGSNLLVADAGVRGLVLKLDS